MNRDDLRRARGVLPHPSKDPVLPNPDATGQFVFITLRPDLDEAGAKAFLRTLQDATTTLQQQTNGEGSRVATVATGFAASFFTTAPATPRFIGLTSAPAGFTEPPAVDGSTAVPADLVCYVVSTSEGCAARFIAAVTADPGVASVNIERGYQRLDRSEPFGYRDGVRNIEDKANRPEVVLVDRDKLPEEPWWAHDGTYLAYLKVEQDTAAMAARPAQEQDEVVGRTRTGYRLDSDQAAPLDIKAESEFITATPPVDSHVRKAGPRGALHDSVRIFRRGLPYYEVGDDGRLRQGLQFASFQASLGQFDVVFNRWMSNPAFPRGGPNQQDRFLAQGLIKVLRHGFYFIPPETDLPADRRGLLCRGAQDKDPEDRSRRRPQEADRHQRAAAQG